MTNFQLKETVRTNRIKSVVFDMDGTLCLPQPWMFVEMRKSISLHDKSVDILDFIKWLPTEEARAVASSNIASVENKAMLEMVPQPGLIPLLKYLHQNNISKNICTRNLIGPVHYFISNFIEPTVLQNFENILTRDFVPTKPNPDPILNIMQKLDLRADEILMVGDSMDDMLSGKAAGCTTILLENEINKHLKDTNREYIDIVVKDLSEIIDIIERL
ncbi:hypothetical protein TPHA_0E01540 [Tetrapisispora phaffii CBS 4417]|uniref:Uncharacterized protein n=1 Tax=Tetrapisispora phaffii (strain ATCC 24235 / CBS 4417 / NBRC 1672 / NRRL Y-8282 / UCD 70-5) TaxID=1071381 RepID=G8BTL9_TETPH|nr:hypothetical protein TPHA_0E01540 [Tetrapisispora phaffii CBS 4417]CCE63247.1 hypothetical protein TPHA_0E01540 [Tetrapisispora phaffii CBS 4417]